MARKPFYKTAEQMQSKIDEYFNSCIASRRDENGNVITNENGEPIRYFAKPVTITGLARHLGFTSRQALLNYQGKKAFVDTVLRAKLFVEQYGEERLFDRDGGRGAEFSLKYNFRWAQETAASESGAITELIAALKNK